MDSAQEPSQPTTSISSVGVRRAPGVQLSAAQTELLLQAFADSETIFVKREFRSGYSGALVLLVSLGADRAPVVIKLAHPLDLQREYAAYQQFVRQISPQNIAHLQGEPLISADGQLGHIQYSFAGGESHLAATSLRDYYESKGGDASAAVINRIFRSFGRYWWANNRPRLYTLGEQYDRLLPTHLQVSRLEIDGDPSKTLENGKTSVMALRDIDVGQSVRMVGFQVSKMATDGGKMTLTAQPPPNEASAPLRVRVGFEETGRSLPFKVGDVVESFDAEVTATRHMVLCDAAKAALPSFDSDARTFTAEIGSLAANHANFSLLNPLFDLSTLLDLVVETKTSVIHGDLNLQNILVDMPTGFAWIIDFSETREGPTLLDLQRLEVQVITKLVPAVWNQSQMQQAELADLLLSLHSDTLPPLPPNPALLEPFRVLVTLRRLARQYLIDDLNWDEYYHGLVIALVGALKYDELDDLACSLALIAAATTRGLVGHRLSVMTVPATAPSFVLQEGSATQPSSAATAVSGQPPLQTTSKRRFLGVGAAIVVALLAALWAWQSWPTGSPPANSEATQTPAATQNVFRNGIASGATSETVTPGAATAGAAAPSIVTSTAIATQTLEEVAGVTDSETSSAGVATATSLAEESATPGAEQKTTEPAVDVTAMFVSPPSEATEGDSWVNRVDGAIYRFVPEGAFTMGSDDGASDQQPAHRVTLSSFWIMQTEVTNGQFAHCIDAGTCTAPANDRWNNSDFAEHPVTGVTWQQANEYALWAGGRLPTEAEWEKAARGSDEHIYPWGNEITDEDQLNYNFSKGDTMPVGAYPQGASPFGVLDMAGNVEEWVDDWYAADYYASSPEENPAGPEEGSSKVFRGGSYFSNRQDVRSTAREKALPNSNFPSLGFRVVIAFKR